MLFSIITVNLNNAIGLEKTINSIQDQLFNDFEFIIIDGDSQDNSKNIIHQHLRTINHWISEKDSGIYDAMNKGIRIASGDYCIFMNSGDVFFDSDVLKTVANIQEKTDIIAGTAIKSNGDSISPPPSLQFRHLYKNNISHQAEFIKRELFSQIGYYSTDLRILSDYEFNIKAGLSSVSYMTVPHSIAIVEDNGISSTDYRLIDKERNLIFCRLFPSSTMNDYLFWLNPKTYSHPAVSWLIEKPLLMKIIKKLFQRR